jgi:hypothetical protein
MSPPIGNHIALKTVLNGARAEVVAAVVLTVNTEVPDPFGTEFGLNEHVGARVAAGVILVQVRLTVPLNPFTAATVMVDVAEPPAEIVAGERGDAASVKSAEALGAFTVKLTGML